VTPTETASAKKTPRQAYKDWPKKGDERAQPWNLDAVGIAKSDRELEPGARDTISPVVIRHSCPILVSGSADPIVADLGRRLDVLGYGNSVSEGANPFGIVDESIFNAVERFREDYGVEEDPTPYGGTTTAATLRAAQVIGPYTWEAVIRASDRVEDDDEG
jgi:peptidoglycan hydrolase-like protein with peptidoglycan-binding domain